MPAVSSTTRSCSTRICDQFVYSCCSRTLPSACPGSGARSMMRAYALPGLQNNAMAPMKPRSGGNSRTLTPMRADT
eukprot:11177608-Lingulodinium_polyedra.AAC.1